MKTELSMTTLTLPAQWASYIISGDSSSFSLEEGGEEAKKKEIDDFLEQEGVGGCLNYSTQPFFTWTPGGPQSIKACDCLHFTFEVRQ